MKTYFFIFALVLIGFLAGSANPSSAQIDFASSPNPVGSGARALGMGGAFIAVADDATAASWNPGGLIQLARPELSVVGSLRLGEEELLFSEDPEASGKQSVSRGELNYLSASYPFVLFNRAMIVSVAYQHLFDFSRKWDFSMDYVASSGIPVESRIQHSQKGGLSALGISYGARLTRDVSCGVTVNLWEDSFNRNEWEQRTSLRGIARRGKTVFHYDYDSFERYSFSGLNFNLGILWAVNERITLGAVVKTPFTADIEHEKEAVVSISAPFDYRDPTSSRDREELDMPLSRGIGLSYRFSDALSIALDVYQTRWDDFLYTDVRGNKTSFVSGKAESASDIDSTVQVRGGLEYLFIKPGYVIPLRAGIFHDPAPAEGGPDDFFGFSLGSGISVGRCLFDVAYQFRYGDDVGRALVRDYAGSFSEDVAEHALYSSMILHF